MIERKTIFFDSCRNPVIIQRTPFLYRGKPLVVVRIATSSNHGYIAVNEGGGTFGTEKCPSSDGFSVAGWFGHKERWKDPAEALKGIATSWDGDLDQLLAPFQQHDQTLHV